MLNILNKYIEHEIYFGILQFIKKKHIYKPKLKFHFI